MNITPVKTGENEYKLGLWVRDAQRSVLEQHVFYEPESNMYCALGHGITDVDTGDIVNIASGELVETKIVSITKGEKGKPGEVRGNIETGTKIGGVSKILHWNLWKYKRENKLI
ncbi:MAG TPA: hypothetical protein OIM35_01075 [Clostridiaceae bacterium]|nr:hypothetical protein [Clostridiaceae bacterium]